MATRSAKKAASRAPFPFSYEEFTLWHSELSAGLLEPARLTFIRILNETLDQELSDVDRLRVRVSHSRIKSPSRLWNKMLGERYAPRIESVDDISEVIDDLVGVRVTCNNLIDVDTFRKIILSLDPLDAAELPAGLCIDPDSERAHSKESGYRAYHINLHTLIPARGAWKPARGELQVRTLLQDSWGELTHEDTYKPGSNMPDLVTNLAKRMADLLATVDDLAQDLRNELDVLAQHDAGVDDDDEHFGSELKLAAAGHHGSAVPDEADVRDALLAETQRVIGALTRPAPLAQVAWQVQANFGREVTQNWGGFGTFKELLRSASPGVQIINTPPGTVIPPTLASALSLSDNTDPSAGVGVPPEGVPPIVHRLKQHDANLPAVSSERFAALLDAVASALEPATWESLGYTQGTLGIRELNQLTRMARDSSSTAELRPSRAMVDYALKSLYFSQNLRPGLGRGEVAQIFSEWIFARASRLGLVVDPVNDRLDLEQWISAAG